MYVSQLLAKGFRSLEDVSIYFNPGLNVLVGKNNAGKSNIIHALNVLLGERYPIYAMLEERDFYRPSQRSSPRDRMLLAVRLEGGNYNRSIIAENNIGTYVYSLDDGPVWNDFDELEAEPSGSREWKAGEDLASIIDTARFVWIYLLARRARYSIERVFGIYLKNAIGRWSRLQRVRGEIRDALLTTAHVPSFRDPDRQLRITQYSWYGKLIKSLYNAKTDEKAQEIERLQTDLTEAMADVFEEVTADLRNRLGRAIFHHAISFQPGAFTADHAHKGVTIFVDDGVDGPFYEKGSGIQSALVMALFAYYCSHFHQGGSLLLAEEPELYLHPQARRAIEAQLVEFVEEGTPKVADPREACNRQVIISTHSAEFLRSADLRSIVCVRKPPGRTKTTIRQIRDVQDQTTLRRWRQMIKTKNAEMFFADHVILVEGGEEYILSALAYLKFGEPRWLDSHNISVVRADGKRQFAAYAAILNKLDIQYTILADLDFLRSGVDDFQNRFSQAFWDRLQQAHNQLAQSDTLPKGRDVKEALSPGTRDWLAIYKEVSQAIKDLTSGGTVEPDRGIFILRRGELEDYLTEEALQLGDSKDRRALAVAEKLEECENLEQAERWIHTEEFIALLEVVESRARAIQAPAMETMEEEVEAADVAEDDLPF